MQKYFFTMEINFCLRKFFKGIYYEISLFMNVIITPKYELIESPEIVYSVSILTYVNFTEISRFY